MLLGDLRAIWQRPPVEEHVDPDQLCDVLARFPGSGDQIRKLFQEDEPFRELCADYGECLAALRRFRKEGAVRDDQIEQYTELLVNLEQELLVRVSELTNHRAEAEQ